MIAALFTFYVDKILTVVPWTLFLQVLFASGVDSVIQYIYYQPIIHRWRETDFFPCSVTCGGGRRAVVQQTWLIMLLATQSRASWLTAVMRTGFGRSKLLFDLRLQLTFLRASVYVALFGGCLSILIRLQVTSWLQQSALTCEAAGWLWISIAIITQRTSSLNPNCRSATWSPVWPG